MRGYALSHGVLSSSFDVGTDAMIRAKAGAGRGGENSFDRLSAEISTLTSILQEQRSLVEELQATFT